MLYSRGCASYSLTHTMQITIKACNRAQVLPNVLSINGPLTPCCGTTSPSTFSQYSTAGHMSIKGHNCSGSLLWSWSIPSVPHFKGKVYSSKIINFLLSTAASCLHSQFDCLGHVFLLPDWNPSWDLSLCPNPSQIFIGPYIVQLTWHWVNVGG